MKSRARQSGGIRVRPAILAAQAQGGVTAGGRRGFPTCRRAQGGAGVIGVETARTSSRKQVIFAWFRQEGGSRAHSDTHRSLQKGFAPGSPARTPMADVPDDGTPIMAIASLTLAGTPSPENPFPVSQIAIELYKPLPGGLAAGGRFSPSTMKVPGLVDVPMPAK